MHASLRQVQTRATTAGGSPALLLCVALAFAAGCTSTAPLTSADYNLAPPAPDAKTETLRIEHRPSQRVWTERFLATSEGGVELRRFEAYQTELDAVGANNQPIAGKRRYETVLFRIIRDGVVEESQPELAGVTIVFPPDAPPRSLTGDPLDPAVARQLSLVGFDEAFIPLVPVYAGATWQVPEQRQRELREFLRGLGLIAQDSIVELTWLAAIPDWAARAPEFSLRHDASPPSTEPLAPSIVVLDLNWSATGVLVGGDPPVPAKLTLRGFLAYDRHDRQINDVALVATQQWSGNTARIAVRLLRSRYGEPKPAIPLPLPFARP